MKSNLEGRVECNGCGSLMPLMLNAGVTITLDVNRDQNVISAVLIPLAEC